MFPSLSRLSSRDRRALSLGALVAIPALGWTLVAGPYVRTLRGARAELAAERDLLVREQTLLAEVRYYAGAFDVGARRLAGAAPRLFGGDDNGAVGAALLAYVQRLALASRVFVAQIEPRSAVAAGGGLTSIALDISGESDLEGLLTLLHALEAGPKLVRVDRLEMRQASPAGHGSAAAASAEVLSFDLTATGFTLLPSRPQGDHAGSPEARP